jgi:hypothetical protein
MITNSGKDYKIEAGGLSLLFRDNTPVNPESEISFRGLDDVDGNVEARIYADVDDGLALQSDLNGITINANAGNVNIRSANNSIVLDVGSEISIDDASIVTESMPATVTGAIDVKINGTTRRIPLIS